MKAAKVYIDLLFTVYIYLLLFKTMPDVFSLFAVYQTYSIVRTLIKTKKLSLYFKLVDYTLNNFYMDKKLTNSFYMRDFTPKFLFVIGTLPSAFFPGQFVGDGLVAISSIICLFLSFVFAVINYFINRRDDQFEVIGSLDTEKAI